MLQNSEPVFKPSFFDDLGPLEDFSFWKPITGNIKKFSDVKHIEGNLFKKSKSSNFWKSRYYILFDDRLAYLKSGRNKTETAYCLLQNLRVEVINSTEKERDEKFGIRFIHNGQCIELYARSLETQEKWMEKLKSFCILNTFSEEYNIIKKIGEGSYAQVNLATRKSDGMQFAVKTFEKRQLCSSVEKTKASLINEINVMRKLIHENIAKLYEVHETETHIYLVLELLRGGELYQRIAKRGPFTEKDALALMKNLIGALAYMHSKGIMHRDIKPENLLLEDPQNISKVKIADFGLGTLVNQGELLFKRCGTPGYVAPEILVDAVYDQKVDVFSAGVILYILLAGMSPFKGLSYHEILIKNKHCMVNFNISKMGHGVSEQAIDLLTKMLAKDPNDRITSQECLEHPWMTSSPVSDPNSKSQTGGFYSSAHENMKKFQEESRFNVKHIKPKDLDPTPEGVKVEIVECFKFAPPTDPTPEGVKVEIVECIKFAPPTENDDEIDLGTEESESDDRKVIRCQKNFTLLTHVNTNSTKSSLNTLKSKPDTRLHSTLGNKILSGVHSHFANFLRSTPIESKPAVSEFEKRKEKEVQKNVSNVKMNLRTFF